MVELAKFAKFSKKEKHIFSVYFSLFGSAFETAICMTFHWRLIEIANGDRKFLIRTKAIFFTSPGVSVIVDALILDR